MIFRRVVDVIWNFVEGMLACMIICVRRTYEFGSRLVGGQLDILFWSPCSNGFGTRLEGTRVP